MITICSTSGGGFSNVYPIPDYQAEAVTQYFEVARPNYTSYEMLDGFKPNETGTGIYNRIGRGMPDVAALGQDVITINKGYTRHSGGTSASSPIFASIITRINDARMNMGKRVSLSGHSLTFALVALFKPRNVLFNLHVSP